MKSQHLENRFRCQNPHCKSRTSIFFDQRALQIHISKTTACEEFYDQLLEKRPPKRRREIVDEMETAEDPPPSDWENERDILDVDLDIDAEFRAALRLTADEVESMAEDRSSDRPDVVESEDIEGEGLYVKSFPGEAGKVYGQAKTIFEELKERQENGTLGEFGPFKDEDEWELGLWLLNCGTSQRMIAEFLKLNAIRDRVRPSYKDKRTFFEKIDTLPHGAPWTCHTFEVEGDVELADGEKASEVLDLWYRPLIDIIRELLGNPDFKAHLRYAPEKLFADEKQDEEIINEMWMAEEWWKIQSRIENKSPGATIAPLIFASDKTQLSQFSGDKQAWPVYLSIGNLEKSVRRQPSRRRTILVGYLPVATFDCFKDKNVRSVRKYRLFHYCMRKICEPLIKAGLEGVKMTCADGNIRHVFPIFSAYIADFPEQCLILCCQENSCPICQIDPDDRGEPISSPLRNVKETLWTLRLRKKDPHEADKFEKLHLRPIDHPFWEHLPYCDIFKCFTPDLLHQLSKGVFKDHVVAWCIAVEMGLSKLKKDKGREIDQCFQAMPDYSGLRHFKKGISLISQWTGREYKQMECVFASLIFGCVPPEVAAVARAVVDFVYYASFQSHSTETLRRLQDALNTFHEHKSVFTKGKYKIHDHFRIPKIHAMEHYVMLIRAKGTADGFNTEISERLHIDYAKEGYRASNRKDYIEQMVVYLDRREAVNRFKAFREWLAREEGSVTQNLDGDSDGSDLEDHEEQEKSSATSGWIVAKKPPFRATPLQEVAKSHGAMNLLACLTDFVEHSLPHTRIRPTDVEKVDVYRKMHQNLPSPQRLNDDTIRDTVWANPPFHSLNGRNDRPGRYDVVLFKEDPNGEEIGLENYRAARVRVLFRISPQYGCPDLLAYVDWFTAFGRPLESNSRFQKIEYQTSGSGQTMSSIIPVSYIARSCYLTPFFGSAQNWDHQSWTSENVLDKCTTFLFNSHISIPMFQICDGDYEVVEDG